MNWLLKFFKRPASANQTASQEQAVLIYLNGKDLSQEVYDKFDLTGLEDELLEVIDSKSLGELDGNEIGPGETTIFLYGLDGEALYVGIEPILKKHPLCQLSRVIIRKGPPGSPQREMRPQG